MSNRLPAGYVLPNPRIPKAVGFFNVLFGVLLLPVGLACMAFFVLVWNVNDGFAAAEAAVAKSSSKPIEPGIAQLKELEASAQTAEDRARYKAERITLEKGSNAKTARPTQPSAVVTTSGGKVTMSLNARPAFRRVQPATVVFFWIESTLGLILNVAMIASGMGLISLYPWARRTALWVAGLKIARLLLMTILSIFWILPLEYGLAPERAARAAAAQKVVDGTTAPTAEYEPDEVDRGLAAVETVTSIGLLVFGSIYPILVVILLTRPAAKAAFVTARRGDGRAAPLAPTSQ